MRNKVRIEFGRGVSDTKVFDVDTGAEIRGVVSVEVRHEVGGLATAAILFRTGDAKTETMYYVPTEAYEVIRRGVMDAEKLLSEAYYLLEDSGGWLNNDNLRQKIRDRCPWVVPSDEVAS